MATFKFKIDPFWKFFRTEQPQKVSEILFFKKRAVFIQLWFYF